MRPNVMKEMRAKLNEIGKQVREVQLTLAQQGQADEKTYIIWKRVNDRNVDNVNDVVGLYTGTYEQADLDSLDQMTLDADLDGETRQKINELSQGIRGYVDCIAETVDYEGEDE